MKSCLLFPQNKIKGVAIPEENILCYIASISEMKNYFSMPRTCNIEVPIFGYQTMMYEGDVSDCHLNDSFEQALKIYDPESELIETGVLGNVVLYNKRK